MKYLFIEQMFAFYPASMFDFSHIKY